MHIDKLCQFSQPAWLHESMATNIRAEDRLSRSSVPVFVAVGHVQHPTRYTAYALANAKYYMTRRTMILVA